MKERAEFKDLFVKGKCVICGKPQAKHTKPSSIPIGFIYRHRINEKRDCLFFRDCLDKGARLDIICCPCVVCGGYLKGES